MSKHKPLDFEELDRLFSYDSETGEIRNKVDRGQTAKAGRIATGSNGKGYLRVYVTKNSRQSRYQAHRVAWLLHTGEDPGELEIDHLNRIKDDNRFCNFELVTPAEHHKRHPKRKDNKSRVTGVYWNKNDNKWIAQITAQGRQQTLGRFKDKFEAICCRKSAERRLGFHENHGK